MVSVSLQSIADYFIEAQQGFNWISLETGAMVIGGLEGFINSKLYYFHFFGRFFMFLLAFLFYVFIGQQTRRPFLTFILAEYNIIKSSY